MSEKSLAAKQVEINEIKEAIESSVSFVAVDYLGINVKDVTDLRAELRAENISFKVLKNTLIRRALDELGIDYKEEVFVGPTAIAFSKDDAVAPARILKKYADKVEALELKGGRIDGKSMAKEEIARIASLPNREGLYSMLLSVLQAPVRNVAYAVKAVQEAKSEDAAE